MKFKHYIALFMVVLIGLPSAVEFHHLATHEHEICLDRSADHLHQTPHECQHTWFSSNHSFLLEENQVSLNILPELYTPKVETVLSLNSELFFQYKSLRAPPVYV